MTRSTKTRHAIRITALTVTALLVASCGGSLAAGQPTATQTPYIIVYTATPLSAEQPIAPEATATPTVLADPSATPDPTSQVTPTAPLTPTAMVAAVTETAAPPSATPQSAPPTQRPPNLLTNPSFEGSGHIFNGAADMVVADGWEPFACSSSRPWLLDCHASRSDGRSGNPDDLMMERPVYYLTSQYGRVRHGASGQAWACPSRTCRGGVYQTVPTTPGWQCEAGVYVRSLSGSQSASRSNLRTTDDRMNSTWYVRVDPYGGTDAYSMRLRVSRPYSYADGVYDQFAKISTTFTAESEQATIFLENFRLWPLPFNENTIDDAFVYCSPPAEGTYPPPDPRERIALGPFGVIARHVPWTAGRLGDIVQVGNEWWMYYDLVQDNAPLIWRAVSTDGLNWVHDPAPVLQIAEPSSRRVVEVSGLSVLYDEPAGEFRMWRVEGWYGDSYAHQIGAARSTDGITWEGVPANVPGGAPGAWNEERIDRVEVIRAEDRYLLYHGGSQLQPTILRQFGCYISMDTTSWTACANPIFSPRTDLAPFEGLEVEQPRIIYHDGVYLMVYTGYLGPQGNDFGIGFAVSLDGQNWQRLFSNPVIPLEGDIQTTSSPAIIYDTASKALWLYYMEHTNEFSVAVAPLEFKGAP